MAALGVTALGVTDGAAVGAIDGDKVGLALGTVSSSSSSRDSVGTNRMMPAPKGGTDTTVHPVPLAPAGVHVSADRSPIVTSTLM